MTASVIKLKKKPKPKAKHKKWYEKHHDGCMALRQAWGVKEGDGLSYLRALQQGTESEQELAKTYQKMARDGFWSVDYMDAMMAIYETWFDKLVVRETMAKRSRIRLVKDDS